MTDPLNLLTADQRTDIFLNELESSIRNDASVLTVFVEVLRQSDAAYYATIIRIISESDVKAWGKILSVPTIMFVSECSLESLSSSGSAQALDSARAGVSPPPPPPAEQGGLH